MAKPLRVHNTLSGEKEDFQPLNPPYVGMYVCGPTVYSDVHLGNVRTFLSFDIIYRYLKYLGYKVRYVRNITDVGHLENDADEGEDKIAKKAKLENLEPMEIVQRYANDFHNVLHQFNLLDPDIEPTATGHIVEQMQMTQTLLDKGLAYEVNGSVYFDVEKYNEQHGYGQLSRRNIDDLRSGSRELSGQSEKRSGLDFALWKNAKPEHIMRWPSPWGNGFPGWHLECTVMSTKYLGETFDIHGGGMDLKFPHHECEIAQSVGAVGKEPAKYWLHTNMLTVNGQKMSKSLGNSFLPRELFAGEHKLLDRGYSPMTVRFFMLQSHYASTLDFSNEALLAAQKGYKKLMNGLKVLREMEYPETAGELDEGMDKTLGFMADGCSNGLSDDFNTAITIGSLFKLLKRINSFHTQAESIGTIRKETFEKVRSTYQGLVLEVLGLKEEKPTDIGPSLELVLDLYRAAKRIRDYDRVDQIRASMKEQGILIKDLKDSVEWAYEE